MHKPLLGYDVEDINNFHQGELSVIICFGIFACTANFSSFNPCPTLSSGATGDRKQFQWLNIVLKNQTGPSFSNSIKMIANSVT